MCVGEAQRNETDGLMRDEEEEEGAALIFFENNCISWEIDDCSFVLCAARYCSVQSDLFSCAFDQIIKTVCLQQLNMFDTAALYDPNKTKKDVTPTSLLS